MDYVLFYSLVFVIGTAISWVTLLIVIPIAQKLADFSMPPWPETLWKLAVVAGAYNGVLLALTPVNIFLAWIAMAVVFFSLMVKWFDVDFFGAVIIVVVSAVVRFVANMLLAGLLMKMH